MSSLHKSSFTFSLWFGIWFGSDLFSFLNKKTKNGNTFSPLSSLFFSSLAFFLSLHSARLIFHTHIEAVSIDSTEASHPLRTCNMQTDGFTFQQGLHLALTSIMYGHSSELPALFWSANKLLLPSIPSPPMT